MNELFLLAIKRIKEIKNLHTDTQVAEVLGITKNNLYAFKNRNTLPVKHIHTFCSREGIRFEYIVDGTMPVYDKEVSAPISEAQQPYSANHKTSDLLIKTASVLESTTVFSGALKSNIEAFHTAIRFEAELDDANRKINDLQNKMKDIESRLLTLEKIS
jgi:hypothetical protein